MIKKAYIFLIIMLFLPSCAQNDVPSWVLDVRSGNGTLKLDLGDKIMYRSNVRGGKGSAEKICAAALDKNRDFIARDYPFASEIPMTTEIVFFDPEVGDCSTTISISRDTANDLARTNRAIEETSGQPRIVFTEAGGDKSCAGAPLEVVSEPPGAFVTLADGKYYGTAPIKFGNICDGGYELKATLADYRDASATVRVPDQRRVSLSLERGQKNIIVRTNMANARIAVNGKDMGTEPVAFSAPLGVEQTIEASHPGAVTTVRRPVFTKASNQTYLFRLEKKRARIDFSAFRQNNPGIKVFLNGKEIKGNLTDELRPDINYALRFKKDDGGEVARYLTLKGGETHYYDPSPLPDAPAKQRKWQWKS